MGSRQCRACPRRGTFAPRVREACRSSVSVYRLKKTVCSPVRKDRGHIVLNSLGEGFGRYAVLMMLAVTIYCSSTYCASSLRSKNSGGACVVQYRRRWRRGQSLLGGWIDAVILQLSAPARTEMDKIHVPNERYLLSARIDGFKIQPVSCVVSLPV